MIKKYHESTKMMQTFDLWPFAFIGQAITGWKMTFAAIEKAGSFDPEKSLRPLRILSGGRL